MMKKQEWLESVLSNLGPALITTDRDGRITYMNPFSENLLGKSLEDVRGAGLGEILTVIDETTRLEAEVPVRQAIRKGDYLKVDRGLLLQDGKGRFLRMAYSLSPLRDIQGEIFGAAFVLCTFEACSEEEGEEDPEAEGKERLEEAARRRAFYIRKNGGHIRLYADEIEFIEAMENYVVFATSTERHIVHATMKRLAEKLRPEGFLRVHRSYIVPLRRIAALTDRYVLIGNRKIPLGKSYRGGLLNALDFI